MTDTLEERYCPKCEGFVCEADMSDDTIYYCLACVAQGYDEE